MDFCFNKTFLLQFALLLQEDKCKSTLSIQKGTSLWMDFPRTTMDIRKSLQKLTKKKHSVSPRHFEMIAARITLTLVVIFWATGWEHRWSFHHFCLAAQSSKSSLDPTHSLPTPPNPWGYGLPARPNPKNFQIQADVWLILGWFPADL